MEYSPMESESRRESAVIERAARADMQADMDRMRAQLVKAEATVAALRQDVRLLEATIAEYERLERQASTDE
jgi:predicted  nucleic acid-binding Zn-ribbon protein